MVEGGQVLRLLPGPYRVRHYAAHLQVVAQTMGITSQYRAVGHPIAGALLEQCVYDETGQLLTTTLMDYLVPTTADIPAIETHHLESPSPTIVGGFKGTGEAGTTGAPAAILNAVNDALAPFRVMITEVPITPDLIHRTLQASTMMQG